MADTSVGTSQFKIGEFIYKYQDAQSSQILNTKEDKVPGKGLSTNDFTNERRDKLAGIEAGAQVNPTIDSVLDNISTNPIQNKAVKEAIDNLTTLSNRVATTTTVGVVSIGDNLTVDEYGRVSADAPYILPVATLESDPNPHLGGIKVGASLDIDQYGVLNYLLPPAVEPTLEVPEPSLGGIIVGNNLEIDEDGVLSGIEVTANPLSNATEELEKIKIDDIIYNIPIRMNYSSNEQVVGTWIDGKTIYQKTVDLKAGASLTDGSWSSITLDPTISNVDCIVNVIFHSQSPNNNSIIRFSTNNGDILAASHVAVTLTEDYKVTFQYTKVTSPSNE